MIKKNVENENDHVPSCKMCNMESRTSKVLNKNDNSLSLNGKNKSNLLNTPLNVIDLEQLGDHTLKEKKLVSTLSKGRKDSDEESMKFSPKRVTFFPLTDKNDETLTNLEEQSEMLFVFNHKNDS